MISRASARAKSSPNTGKSGEVLGRKLARSLAQCVVVEAVEYMERMCELLRCRSWAGVCCGIELPVEICDPAAHAWWRCGGDSVSLPAGLSWIIM